MKKFLLVLFFIIFGTFLRLISIDKAEGLWNDEYISWMISSVAINGGFWNAVKSQCHMPLYYLYLKLIMTLFGQSDLILRLSSLICGIAAIPVMYYAGKEKDNYTAVICALFTSISSFLIYYSQEVRLYSLLFLISALTFLFTVKLIKYPNKKNLILTLVFNFLIIFTHTIGFVFVFFNLIFISINLFKKYKKFLICLWSVIFILFISVLPIILKILTTKSFSQWWGHFTLSKICYLFTDYFSPVLVNLTNAPDKFIFTPTMIITGIIAVFFITKSLFKNKLNIGLFAISFCVVTIMTIASISGKLVFITKYSIEIYPILIFLFCCGAASLNNKIIRNIILSIYFILSIGYVSLSPISAPRLPRLEGHKLVTDTLKNMNLNSGDFILIEYYPQNRFDKYFDFSDYNVISVNKGNFPYYLLPDTNYEQTYSNGKELYRNMFLNGHNEYYESMLKKEIFDKMQPGQNLVIITLDSVAVYNTELIQKIAGHDIAYKKTPLLFLIFSYIKYENFYDTINMLEFRGNEKHGSWTIVKFTKLNK